jgi:hypothetical protein
MSSMRTRSRQVPSKIGGGVLNEKSQDNFYPYLKTDTTNVGEPSTIYGSQITDSEGHPFRHQSGVNIGDVGGEFYTVRQYITGAQSAVKIEDVYSQNGVDYQTVYQGTALPIVPHRDLFPPIVPLSSFREEMNEDGATAVSRVKPTNPIADLSTALGELHTEGIPKIPGISTWKSQTQQARKTARAEAGIRGAKTGSSEFLGVQFGVLPFVSDIQDIARGVADADRIITQYRKDSGKLVRRRYEFPVEEEFSSEVIATGRKPILAKDTSHIYTVIPAGDLVRETKTLTRKVFSGGFTYHLPGDYPGVSEMSNSALYAKKILGLDLSPDTVWNLTPWSWALDWFSNTGDVIDNLSDYATDGLVMRYGYIQRHVTQSHTYYLSSFDGTALSFVTETKCRVKANPFGFGLTWGGLSPRQLAISIALGIDRVF